MNYKPNMVDELYVINITTYQWMVNGRHYMVTIDSILLLMAITKYCRGHIVVMIILWYTHGVLLPVNLRYLAKNLFARSYILPLIATD